MHESQKRSISKLKQKGFLPDTDQHNGILLCRIDTEDMIHRKVVDIHGGVRTYIPRKATDLELQRFLFSRKHVNLKMKKLKKQRT